MFGNDSKTFISLEHKNYVKYLGILIDSNLVWKNHISHVTSKISKTIGTISKLRHFVPRIKYFDKHTVGAKSMSPDDIKLLLGNLCNITALHHNTNIFFY